MTKQMNAIQSGINTWFLRLFGLGWMLFIFLDYQYHTPYLGNVISNFDYWDCFIVILAIIGGLFFWQNKKLKFGKSITIKGLSGWQVYGYLLIVQIIIFLFYLNKSGPDIGISTENILYFIFNSIFIHLLLFLIVLLAYVAGSWLLSILQIRFAKPSKIVVATAFGFAILAFLVFVAGLLGFLKFWVIAPVFLAVLIVGYKNILPFLKNTLFKRSPDLKIHPLTILPFITILIMVSMNLTAMMRPMPIGFDALNLYMNIPNLMGQYETLTAGGQAYNWSLIMSLGFVLFDSTAMALMLSILPGILSIWVVYRIARMQLNISYSILAASLFYSIPVIVWQSSQEAKVDLGLLFIILSAVFCLISNTLNPVKGSTEFPNKFWKHFSKDPQYLQVILITGILAGFAFGIKYTGLFAILAFISLIFYKRLGTLGYFGSYFIGCAFLFGLGLYKFSSIDLTNWSTFFISSISIIIGITLVIISAVKKLPSLGLVIKSTALLLISGMLAFSPWILKNVWEAKSISVDAVMNGRNPLPPIGPGFTSQRNRISMDLDWFFEKYESRTKPLLASIDGPIEFEQDYDQPVNNNQSAHSRISPGVYEEMARYLGYEKGLVRYISVPYDMTMRINVGNYSIDIGYILLMLLPLLLFIHTSRHLLYNLLKAMFLLVVLGIGFYSGWYNQEIYEWGEAGNKISSSLGQNDLFLFGILDPVYLIFSQALFSIGKMFGFLLTNRGLYLNNFIYLILIFSILLSIPLYRSTFLNLGKTGKLLSLFTLIFIMGWFILGSGIIWYALPGITIGIILILFSFKSDVLLFGKDPIIKYTGAVFLFIWLILSVFMRMTSTNPVEDPSFQTYDKEFIKYSSRVQTASYTVQNKIKPFIPTLEILNSQSKGFILRSGTFMNYFIHLNDKRVYIDNQLNLFQYLYDEAGGDANGLVDQFLKYNIRYLVISWKVSEEMTSSVSERKEIFREIMNELGAGPEEQIRLIHFDGSPANTYASIEIVK